MKNGKKRKVLPGNAEKEGDDSKVPTGNLGRKGNQSKMLFAEEKGRNWKEYPRISAKQLKIVLDGSCLDDEHVFLLKRC